MTSRTEFDAITALPSSRCRTMRPSLFPSDDELPTWLHSLLLALVSLPFSGFLLWFGCGALFSGRLEPVEGPDFGQFFFGPTALAGKAARIAGLSLIAAGASFLAIAYRFSRFSDEGLRARLLPWILLAVSVMLSWATGSLH